MYETCPKCQHQRKPEAQEDAASCPACGIIYSKWLKSQLAAASPRPATRPHEDPALQALIRAAGNYVFHCDEKINPLHFWGRVFLFMVLLFWSWKFIQMDFVMNPFQIGRTFMHNINLIFHEAGHLLFMPFGRFMTILGGSLLQVLMPLVVMLSFLIKNRDPFGAAAGLWWMGQSLMDLAPYIDDAIDQKLILLGGRTGADAPGNHDWGNILIELGIPEKHRQIATFADSCGSLLLLLACAWAGYVLFLQFRRQS